MKKMNGIISGVLMGLALLTVSVSCTPEVKIQEVEKKVYTCAYCGTEYTSADDAAACYKGHEETVVEKKVYTCPSCGKEYTTASGAATCYASHQPVADTTAPSKVTNLTAENLDGAVALTWTDPSASDLFGIEINWTPKTTARSVSAMTEGSIFIAPKTQIAEIANLKNGTEYTFTVKAMDTSGNKSSAVTETITPSEIEGSVLTVTLTPDVTSATNQDVNVAVSVSTEENRSVKTIKYASGSQELSYFEKNGTAVSESSFTVTENGVYTVYAQDIDGRVGIKAVAITNIDKTAPGTVTNLTAAYNYTDKKITVSWTNPSDSDFDHVLLSYTKAGTAVVTDEVLTAASYEIADYEADGTTEFVFAVKGVDAVGNAGSSVSCSITPVQAATVTSIELSRYHLAYNDEDQTVVATVHISNASLIEDGTSVKIQVVGSSTTNYEATVDKTAGTATATITAPTTTSSNAGTTYTVRCKIGDTVDTAHTARFNVSAVPSLTGMTVCSTEDGTYSTSTLQLPLSEVTSSSKFYLQITGYNLDLLSTLTVQLYDSTRTAYYSEPVAVDISSIEWTTSTGSNKNAIVQALSIPMTDDIYTVKVIFDGTVQTSYTRTIQIYDVPKFTSFKIPNAGTLKEDNTVTSIIRGKNFTASDVVADNFSAICTEKSSIVSDAVFTIIGDSMATVTLTIPSTADEYTVTVKYGSNSVDGTFIVKDYSAYTVGDVFLNDGTVVSYDAENLTFTDEQKSSAVGILCGFNDYGAPLMIGIQQSSQQYGLTLYDNSINFENISCEASTKDADTATFSGDTDGSDNWEYMCLQDPEGTADAAINYPAFDYVNNYAATAGLTGTYATGWYMPSLAELCMIYINKTIINNVETALGCSELFENDYWSSSRGASRDFGSAVSIKYGSISQYYGRYNRSYVCCVRNIE